MRIKDQSEILQLKVRKKIIEDIEANENKIRKQEAYRRSQCYKDRTGLEVIKMLSKQFDEQTVNEMSYAITNLSIVKKVIKKLARVYKNGVTRTAGNDELTKKVEELQRIFKFNQRVKTQNRWTRLHKNAVMYIKPCKHIDNEGVDYMRPRPTVLQPHLYDVVEDFYDRTKGMVYILSNFNPDEVIYTTADPARLRDGARDANQHSMLGQQRTNGNRRDESIADKQEDEEKPDGKEYIWWSGRYHFTTNSLGQVIRENGDVDGAHVTEDNEAVANPIDELPFVETTIDQDNSFWAEGGEDLVDGAIVANSLMTQNNHIAVVQGYGQIYMMGKNLPDNIKVGPGFIIKLEHEIAEEDPQPTVGVLNASPPLTELQNSIVSQVAMILTTNDLSTSGVSANLDGAQSFPSGVSMLIDKAESMEDVTDEREMFADAERRMWPIIAKFMIAFDEMQMLEDELKDLLIPEDIEITLEFGEQQVITSEDEKLNAIEKRKNIGLNTMPELIMMDRKDFDVQQAEEKLKEIEEEKKARMEEFAQDPNQPNQMSEGDDPNGNQDDEDDGDGDEDS